MVKKAVVLFVVGFGLYYLFSTPDDAATAVRGAFDAAISAFGQVGVFVSGLA
ncbi:hypothetical protein [Aeromicrobium duanguangcaii]|uniref:Uncharacterized protein n=1 Tax=Aeromicrobium duanguangcaii TaxID=2968086 RepID=A0ABY5KCN1_9ACTN|nr:hypothetical protein [Aeromicrobium duanguangcaii]MCD9154960.1 hypothetical protein [Aeromicrobium duanguangcaii]MCL3839000.1 hypothetical protein [Aeromicrobium duanguangcaii]UUI67635.1 hypothetical protein NP095_10515 [Aeromicrobium duanguangcaii]